MLEHVQRVMAKEGRVAPGSRILVGFSGGPDSLALLDCLVRGGYAVTAAHFNHHLRPTSSQEAERAAELARQCGAKFVLGEGDIGEIQRQEGGSVEAVARDQRYKFLFRAAEENQAEAVVTAHTADDQVETILMHLLRGAGLDGLQGMAVRTYLPGFHAAIPLVRPMLGTWRPEVLAYCQGHGLEPILDPSNRDTHLQRNRVRLELLPILESYSPNIRERLERLGDLAREDVKALEEMAELEAAASTRHSAPGCVGIGRDRFILLPLGVQRRVLRRLAVQVLGDRAEVDFAAVQRALEFVRSSRTSGSVDFVRGSLILLEADLIWLATGLEALPMDFWPQWESEREADVPVPGVLPLAGGWELGFEWVEIEPGSSIQPGDPVRPFGPMHAWLDAESLGGPLTLRRRRAGDRFAPLGMAEGSMTVADFMVNTKVPQRARQNWPLLCVGEAVAWVVGRQVGHAFRVREGSGRVVYCVCRREGIG